MNVNTVYFARSCFILLLFKHFPHVVLKKNVSALQKKGFIHFLKIFHSWGALWCFIRVLLSACLKRSAICWLICESRPLRAFHMNRNSVSQCAAALLWSHITYRSCTMNRIVIMITISASLFTKHNHWLYMQYFFFNPENVSF